MNASIKLLLASVGLLTIAGCSAPHAASAPAHRADDFPTVPWSHAPRPRLTVVLVIDQFRGDYLNRFNDIFLPPTDSQGRLGGFNYLMQRGAYFADARHQHYPLFTATGHALVMTGGFPYKTGIVSNDWWSTESHRIVYCVEDPSVKVVGAAPDSTARGMSARNFHSTTVGDELKLATAGKAKTVSIAVKDRASILLGGHSQDVSLWFDSAGGRWISSTAYCKDGTLPAWVQAMNDERIPDRSLGKDWAASLPAATIAAKAMVPVHVGDDLPAGFGKGFPHHIGSESKTSNYRAFIHTPMANDFVFDTAERAIEAEKLGQRDVPDILTLNLSTNDYVGHAFGPYSPEVLEITASADKRLSAFLNYLEQHIPGGMNDVLFVLTGDHGVAPIPDEVNTPPFNLPAGHYEMSAVTKAISDALTTKFGEPAGGSWFSNAPDDPTGKYLAKSGAYMEGLVYLNPAAIQGATAAAKRGSRRDVEDAACDALNGGRVPGIYGCFGKTQILEGRVPNNDLGARLAKAVHPQLSGDLIVIADQLQLQSPPPEAHPTTHGPPFAYDTHVPVVICSPRHVAAGEHFDPASTADIAPTISVLLGVEFPSSCDGHPFWTVLKGRPWNAVRGPEQP